jgi:kynurenine formamidase
MGSTESISELIPYFGDPIDISIPLKFNGPQPNAFGVPPASSAACEYSDIVGDTRLGGSCNFEQIILIPHCNGTHTECVGHIVNERIPVRNCLKDILMRAELVSISAEAAAGCSETYAVGFGTNDAVITRDLIESKLSATKCQALIIRTLPNDDRKLTRIYKDEIPPYFTNEAMEFIVSLGVKHLLVDLPSIDRLYDEGKLSNHRIFWSVEQGSLETNSKTRIHSTITELIYVPNAVIDGEYILNLQIAPFESDASPSRPIISRI